MKRNCFEFSLLSCRLAMTTASWRLVVWRTTCTWARGSAGLVWEDLRRRKIWNKTFTDWGVLAHTNIWIQYSQFVKFYQWQHGPESDSRNEFINWNIYLFYNGSYWGKCKCPILAGAGNKCPMNIPAKFLSDKSFIRENSQPLNL